MWPSEDICSLMTLSHELFIINKFLARRAMRSSLVKEASNFMLWGCAHKALLRFILRVESLERREECSKISSTSTMYWGHAEIKEN